GGSITVAALSFLDLDRSAARRVGKHTNSGTVDAEGTTALHHLDITNTASFKATGGTLTIDSASTIHNTGAGATFEANGGNIVLSGDTVTNTGILNAAAGNTLELINASVTNPGGSITVAALSFLDLD